MDLNTHQLIKKFYESFAKLDAGGMIGCYDEHIIFHDPVFGLLDAEHTRSMWKMLCSRAKDYKLVYDNITAIDHEYFTCDWIASYTYSVTGRRVVNKAKAFMRIENGKIIEHSDGFSVHKWSMMAIGFSGWLLGWNSFYQNKIRKKALQSLEKYMQQEKNKL